MRGPRRALIVAAIAGLLAAPAAAADLPVKAPRAVAPLIYDWNGFYLGAHAGYARGRFDVSAVAPGTGTYFAASSLPAIENAGSASIGTNSVMGGLQAGFNRQWDRIVLGLEADISWWSLKGARSQGG